MFEAFRSQWNFRVHLSAAIGVIGLAAWLRVSRWEWVGLILCIGLVLTTELVNTAIETAVDLACPEQHDLARRAKDVAAGAVLIASLTAAIAGTVILLPHLIGRG
jgi:diacylglycerol kinase